MKDPILHIKELGHHFRNGGKVVFNDINLNVKRGEVVVVLGENGSGKSTLLKCFAGLIQPNHGEVKLNEKNILNWNKKERSKRIAFVSTKNNYSQMHSVQGFIAFGRYPFTNWLGKLREEDQSQIKDTIAECGLNEIKDKTMDALSDGERQKVIIARALAQNTDLLILDEPTTHLDIKNTLAIFQMLKKQAKDKNKALLFSSHQVDWAIDIADKIWIVDQAKVIESTKEEFKNSRKLREILFGEQA